MNEELKKEDLQNNRLFVARMEDPGNLLCLPSNLAHSQFIKVTEANTFICALGLGCPCCSGCLEKNSIIIAVNRGLFLKEGTKVGKGKLVANEYHETTGLEEINFMVVTLTVTFML